MHFGLHLIRKVIKKKSFLIQRAYHSRVLKLEQTEMMEGEGVRRKRMSGGEAKKERTDKVGLVLSQCHIEGRLKCCILHPASCDCRHFHHYR